MLNYKRTGSCQIAEELRREEELGLSGCGGDDDSLEDSPLLASQGPSSQSIAQNDELKPLSLQATIKLSAEFCVLWFLANLVTNASLAYTSVASQTMLSSTSSFFTLFVGALFQVESINGTKMIGSLISFIGIMLVTKSDSQRVYKAPGHGIPSLEMGLGLLQEEYQSPWVTMVGNILALSGAFLYGVYSTLLKKRVKDETRINMKIFFGFVGLFNIIFLWPSLILFHFMGWETFQIPKNSHVIIIVVVNCFITFISDFCWANAMLLTSPLTVTVGLSTTIPLAMFGDFIFNGKPMPLLYFLGALCVLGSFFIINKSSEEDNMQMALQATGTQADSQTVA